MNFTLPETKEESLTSLLEKALGSVARVIAEDMTGLVCTKVWLTNIVRVTRSTESDVMSDYVDNVRPLEQTSTATGLSTATNNHTQITRLGALGELVVKTKGPYGDGLVLHQAVFRVRQHIDNSDVVECQCPLYIVLQNVRTGQEYLINDEFYEHWVVL